MNNDKVTSIKEYQLLKQITEEEFYADDFIFETSAIALYKNEISDGEKQQINNTVKNISSLCGWVLSDHVVMRNGIKLVFSNKDFTEKKEILIQTSESDQIISLLNE